MQTMNKTNEHTHSKEYEKGENMEYTTTGKVLTTLDSYGNGYGYGRNCGSYIGNGLLATQNFFNGQRLENVKDTVQLGFGLSEIRDQSRAMSLDNKIDRQSLAIEARFNSFEQTYNADKKAEYLAEIGVLKNALDARTGCVPTTCNTCCTGSGIDVNQIQFAVGQGIAQVMPTLLAQMGK